IGSIGASEIRRVALVWLIATCQLLFAVLSSTLAVLPRRLPARAEILDSFLLKPHSASAAGNGHRRSRRKFRAALPALCGRMTVSASCEFFRGVARGHKWGFARGRCFPS